MREAGHPAAVHVRAVALSAAARSMKRISTALAVALAIGCRHPARITLAPAEGGEEYCWWTVWHTALPPDTVAARFARAFTAVGLAGAAWTRAADTAWAHAGPTPLDSGAAAPTYEGRLVAYRRGDTTLYRNFLTLAPPQREGAPPPSLHHIGACQAISRAAGVRAWAYREPNAGDSIGVWWSRPPAAVPSDRGAKRRRLP